MRQTNLGIIRFIFNAYLEVIYAKEEYYNQFCFRGHFIQRQQLEILLFKKGFNN